MGLGVPSRGFLAFRVRCLFMASLMSFSLVSYLVISSVFISVMSSANRLYNV